MLVTLNADANLGQYFWQLQSPIFTEHKSLICNSTYITCNGNLVFITAVLQLFTKQQNFGLPKIQSMCRQHISMAKLV